MTSCVCGSGRPVERCCGPIVRNEQTATTAEALMRSRYSAFVLGAIDHLVRSWDPSTRPADMTPAIGQVWSGLEVIDVVAGGVLDQTGEVEFIATYTVGGRPGRLHERSRFRRDAGRWVYVDGDQR